VGEADERGELLVPDWRDTILSVYGRLKDRPDLPEDRDELLQLIETEAGSQIAAEQVAFRARHEADLRAAPVPSDASMNLLRQGRHLEAIEAYRRQARVGLLVARDRLAAQAEQTGVPIPPAWENRKRFPA
jgi:hypothetical protein